MADIGYFDVTSDLQRADVARLRWSLPITTNVSAVMGNFIAHSDNKSVGCRIVVNGQVEAERISNDVNAYMHCLANGV